MADSEYHLHLHHLQRDEDIIEKTGLELANENQELPVLSDEFLDKYLLRDTKTLMVEDTADGLIKWLDLVTRPILMQLCIKDNEKRKRLQRTAGNRRVPPLIFQFIRGLLSSRKYCPKIIRWLDYERKIFRFEDRQKVAQLWGDLRDNPGMTYAKFMRAMRYHYESGKKNANARVLFRSYPNDTVYQFGPDATGL